MHPKHNEINNTYLAKDASVKNNNLCYFRRGSIYKELMEHDKLLEAYLSKPIEHFQKTKIDTKCKSVNINYT